MDADELERLPDGLPLPDEHGAEACSAIPALEAPPPVPAVAWALGGLALVVRTAAAMLDPVPPRDGVKFAETLQLAAAGEGIDWSVFATASHHPLTTWAAMPLHAVGLDPMTALTVVSVLAGGLAAVVLHRMTALLLGDEDAAGAAAVLYAVTPPLVRLGSTALAEPLLHLCVLLSVFAALKTLRHWKPARWALAAGLWGGAGFLARPEALALLPLALLACLPGGGGRPLKNRALALVLAGIGFAALAGPWMAHLSLDRAQVTVFQGKDVAVLTGAKAPANPGGAAPAEKHSLLMAAAQATGALPEAIHPALIVLVLMGVISVFRTAHCKREAGRLILLGLAVAAFWCGVVMLEWRYGYGGRRHASTAGLLLIPLAGSGLLLLATMGRRWVKALERPVAATGAVTLLIALPLLAGSLLQRDESGNDARDLGTRLAEIGTVKVPGTPSGARPVATFGEPRVAWYAGGEDLRLMRRFGIRPGASRDEVEKRADRFRSFLADHPGHYVVLKKDDPRVPPGFPGPNAGVPAATSGRLSAWCAADLVR
ncbi:MAG: ArnT family glycosyltransferase [Planctomycetota bacterium]|jgi:hypothetical protein